jgi:hypothetical protein
MSLVDDLAGAIASFEGAFQTGSVAQRNNNPGNLRTWGNLPRRDGYAVFPTVEAGWEALRKQISLNISRGLNLLEFFGGKPGVYPGYAPASDLNQPQAYASYVAGQVGVPVDVPLAEVSGSGVESSFEVDVSGLLPGSGTDWLVVGALGVAAVSAAILLFRG